MTNTSLYNFASWFESHPLLLISLTAWIMLWKGLALWKAAGLRQRWWFIIILLINTFGILEIIYLFFVAKKYKVEVVES